MPLNSAGSAGGGLLSSSALLLVVLGVLVLFLTHKGIGAWLNQGHAAIRRHFYGPQELYEQTNPDPQEPEASSANSDGADVDPDDGFDYGIFATSPTQGQ